MNMPLTHPRLGLAGTRVAPSRQRTLAPADVLALADRLLERLADWAERQPMHHRLGSYARRR